MLSRWLGSVYLLNLEMGMTPCQRATYVASSGRRDNMRRGQLGCFIREKIQGGWRCSTDTAPLSDLHHLQYLILLILTDTTGGTFYCLWPSGLVIRQAVWTDLLFSETGGTSNSYFYSFETFQWMKLAHKQSRKCCQLEFLGTLMMLVIKCTIHLHRVIF